MKILTLKLKLSSHHVTKKLPSFTPISFVCSASPNTWKIIAEWVIDVTIEISLCFVFVYLCASDETTYFRILCWCLISMLRAQDVLTYIGPKPFDDCFERFRSRDWKISIRKKKLEKLRSLMLPWMINYGICQLIDEPGSKMGQWLEALVASEDSKFMLIARKNQLSQNGF